jgi:hypothetical protein
MGPIVVGESWRLEFHDEAETVAGSTRRQGALARIGDQFGIGEHG